jgi:hypothetical protein
MPAWAWVVIGVVALGFVLWFFEEVLDWRASDFLGKVLAILLLLAVLGGLVYGIVGLATASSGTDSTAPERGDCSPYRPGSC